MSLSEPASNSRDPGAVPGLPSLAEFSARVGTEFRLAGGLLGGAALKLVEATARQAGGAVGVDRPALESFSLLFQAPDTRLLPQGVYRLEHDGAGSFDLFIVPIGRSSGVYRYEAVINRLVA